jgi:hypothetical protein
MLEAHAPHEPIHSWKGFFISIGAIAIGLLLALGLQQTAEAIHQGHERVQLERAIHATLELDVQLYARNAAQLRRLNAHLSELLEAITAKLHGNPSPVQPSLRDPRVRAFLLYPGLAPYDAAQMDGTVTVLRVEEIRLYSRLSLVRDAMKFSRDHWVEQTAQLEAFQKRYANTRGVMSLNAVTAAPDIRTLSTPELLEYRQWVAALIERTDDLLGRMDRFDLLIRSILAGATDEVQMIDDNLKARPQGFGVDPDKPSAP